MKFKATRWQSNAPRSREKSVPLTSKPTSTMLIIAIHYILGRTLRINIRISHGLGVILNLLAARNYDSHIKPWIIWCSFVASSRQFLSFLTIRCNLGRCWIRLFFIFFITNRDWTANQIKLLIDYLIYVWHIID